MKTGSAKLGYALTLVGVVLGSALAVPLKEVVDLSNIALFYVLLVVVIGIRFGRGPSILCALASSLAFALIFVPPDFSFAIHELQDLITALIMLVVALLVGHLTATLASFAQRLEERAAQSAALYELARDLAGKQTSVEVEACTLAFFAASLQVEDAQWLAASDFDAPPIDAALIEKSLNRRRLTAQAAGRDGKCFAVLPLFASAGAQGVLAFAVGASRLDSPRFLELAETVASLVAVALERTHFAELARKNELENAAQNLRCAILSSLSHDIRTPLTALIGTADTLLLAASLAPAQQQSLLAGLREQAQSIHQLVVNLLEIARLQSGKVELNRAWQPIDEVLEVALKQAAELAPTRRFGIAIDPGLPPLRIDAVLIERVLWNLIENACKYSPAETPIEISASGRGDYVDIAVADRGAGLPPGKEEAIFRIFERGTPESSLPGAGLGLAIARSITDAHGGELLANNRDGGGSVFHLLLPVGSPPCLELDD